MYVCSVMSKSFVTSWVVACEKFSRQFKSMEFSRQEHWSGLPFPTPELHSNFWLCSHVVEGNKGEFLFLIKVINLMRVIRLIS